MGNDSTRKLYRERTAVPHATWLFRATTDLIDASRCILALRRVARGSGGEAIRHLLACPIITPINQYILYSDVT